MKKQQDKITGQDFAWFLLAIVVGCTLALCMRMAGASPREVVIDTVVASVDNKAVTLIDVNSRLSHKVSAAEISKDVEATKALNQVIFERLIEVESKDKRIVVTDSDVTNYVGNVAKQNNWSPEEFKAALASTGISGSIYREQVKAKIGKAKLVSTLVLDGASTYVPNLDRDIVQNSLQKQETKDRLTAYFTNGIYKNHVVTIIEK